jgi:hypothetical protein
MLQTLRDQGIRFNDGVIEAVEGIRKLTLVLTSNSAPEISDGGIASVRIVSSTRRARRSPQKSLFASCGKYPINKRESASDCSDASASTRNQVDLSSSASPNGPRNRSTRRRGHHLDTFD